MTVLVAVAVALAAVPVSMALVDLALFRRPRAVPSDCAVPPVSVLIPARDEAARIGPTLEAVLASGGVEIEVIVLDDASTDETAEVVSRVAECDGRVRLVRGRGPPPGWNGKQRACDVLGRLARHDLLLFVDADVHFAPGGIASLLRHRRRVHADLLAVFPHQQTGALMERLLLPLIHFVLLGYLPFPGMRWSRSPAFAAGCGQVVLVRREAWLTVGGHGAIRATRHDGLRLPRAFRRAGFITDVADGTRLASCRMYRGARETWRGLAKNADEGLGSNGGIVPWSVLLLGGQVAPWLLLVAGIATAPVLAAALSGPGLRLVFALRFRQSPLGAVLHPLGVLLLVAIQWHALFLRLVGRPIPWRQRP